MASSTLRFTLRVLLCYLSYFSIAPVNQSAWFIKVFIQYVYVDSKTTHNGYILSIFLKKEEKKKKKEKASVHFITDKNWSIVAYAYEYLFIVHNIIACVNRFDKICL